MNGFLLQEFSSGVWYMGFGAAVTKSGKIGCPNICKVRIPGQSAAGQECISKVKPDAMEENLQEEKQKTSWWEHYTTGFSFLPHLMPVSSSVPFSQDFLRGGAGLENLQLTWLASAYPAIFYSLPANAGEQASIGHVCPKTSHPDFPCWANTSHRAPWYLLTLWTEFPGTWQVPLLALWPHRRQCDSSPDCCKNKERVLKTISKLRVENSWMITGSFSCHRRATLCTNTAIPYNLHQPYLVMTVAIFMQEACVHCSLQPPSSNSICKLISCPSSTLMDPTMSMVPENASNNFSCLRHNLSACTCKSARLHCVVSLLKANKIQFLTLQPTDEYFLTAER